MSILKNAIESIQVGVEDFLNLDPKRSLSSARNIFAGLLLLYKEKLRRLSPPDSNDALMKNKFRPGYDGKGNLIFIGDGVKTAEVQDIIDRFKNLNIQFDSGKLKELQNLRNNIEHYYTDNNPTVIREIVARSFILIRDFITDVLNEKPHDVFGDDCWYTLLSTNEVYEAEKNTCRKSFEGIRFSNIILEGVVEKIRCPACHLDLIKAEHIDEFNISTSLSCCSCGTVFLFGTVMKEYLTEDQDASVDSFAYCMKCRYTEQPSVVYLGDEWVCLSCLTVHDQVGDCGYCNEFIAGDSTDSFMDGCLMCEGQSGHYRNSRAYGRDD